MKEDWEDYYEILGVNPDSGAEEIKKAYRDACLIYHPDRLMNAPESARRRAEEELKRINRAYSILGDPQKRQEYHAEWISQKAKAKPIVNPDHIYFKDVKPGEIKVASFVVKNMGGPYEKLFISNPDSWVRVANYFSLTDSDELPLQVDIEAEGKNWGKSYSGYITVKLDEEESHVKVELQTRPEPVREKVRVGARPSARSAYTPPPPLPITKKAIPAWGKLIGTMLGTGIGFGVGYGAGLLGQVGAEAGSGLEGVGFFLFYLPLLIITAVFTGRKTKGWLAALVFFIVGLPCIGVAMAQGTESKTTWRWGALSGSEFVGFTPLYPLVLAVPFAVFGAVIGYKKGMAK